MARHTCAVFIAAFVCVAAQDSTQQQPPTPPAEGQQQQQGHPAPPMPPVYGHHQMHYGQQHQHMNYGHHHYPPPPPQYYQPPPAQHYQSPHTPQQPGTKEEGKPTAGGTNDAQHQQQQQQHMNHQYGQHMPPPPKYVSKVFTSYGTNILTARSYTPAMRCPLRICAHVPSAASTAAIVHTSSRCISKVTNHLPYRRKVMYPRHTCINHHNNTTTDNQCLHHQGTLHPLYPHAHTHTWRFTNTNFKSTSGAHQQYLNQFMPGMPQQQYQQDPYASWHQGGNQMPDPSHFQHAENMHNIPGAAGGAGAQQQAQPQTFGGHGGKYVPPPHHHLYSLDCGQRPRRDLKQKMGRKPQRIMMENHWKTK